MVVKIAVNLLQILQILLHHQVKVEAVLEYRINMLNGDLLEY